jgi:hypothetical protein
MSDNISTAEDPVEYNLLGINQVQINEEIGLSFASALRAFLRQDPDTARSPTNIRRNRSSSSASVRRRSRASSSSARRAARNARTPVSAAESLSTR